MPPRTVAVVGAVCLTVGWLLASTLAPPVASLQSLPQRQPKTTPVAEETAFTGRLQLKMEHTPVPPSPRRNPFVFGRRARIDAATPPPAAASSATDATLPPSIPVPVGPVFTLAGIGVSGEIRTAILTDGQEVHLMKVGERLGGYDIVEITDNSVTLAEASGMRWLLRLR